MGRKVIPGDIIFCDRGFYSHFGIYVGELNVIHFDSNFIDKVTGYKDPRIAKTDVEKFRCEDKIYTILHKSCCLLLMIIVPLKMVNIIFIHRRRL